MTEYKECFQLPPGTMVEINGPFFVEEGEMRRTEVVDRHFPIPDFNWVRTEHYEIDKKIILTIPYENLEWSEGDNPRLRISQRR